MIKKNKTVISLGGGAFLNNKIKKEILDNHISFWLNWDIKTLVNRIKDSGLIKMINQGDAWFYITDEIQTGIKRANGRVDEQLAARKMDIANMWSYVPGFS